MKGDLHALFCENIKVKFLCVTRLAVIAEPNFANRMSEIKHFSKGDIILTNPEEGFWGIAIVLSEKAKTNDSYSKCHIAITPLLFRHEIKFEDLNHNDLAPLEFERLFSLKGQPEFFRKEICIGVYTRRNKPKLKVIGSIDPSSVYNGPLPFEPWYDLETSWPLYGDPTASLGREAYIVWERSKNTA